ANHEDAYDSDVDDGPDASVAFMANFSSAGSPSSSNNISINERIRFRILNIWHLMMSILVDHICRFMPQLSIDIATSCPEVDKGPSFRERHR
nr:hypothetical protein [Tanacetum cinerariifolium]